MSFWATEKSELRVIDGYAILCVVNWQTDRLVFN